MKAARPNRVSVLQGLPLPKHTAAVKGYFPPRSCPPVLLFGTLAGTALLGLSVPTLGTNSKAGGEGWDTTQKENSFYMKISHVSSTPSWK